MNHSNNHSDLGAHQLWRRLLWVAVIVLLVLLARRLAGGADVWSNANTLLTQGKAVEAEQAFDKLLRQNPEDARGYMGRGRARWRLKKNAEAVADFTKVIERTPKDSTAFNNRALAYEGLGDREKALSDYSKAIELNPKNAVHHENRGML